MGRNIIAVIAGYIAMALFVMVGLTLAYLIMGADRAFMTGSYEITPLWMLVMFVVGAAAALLGGVVCAKVSRHRMAATIALSVVVAVLGGIMLAVQAASPPPSQEEALRDGDTPNFEAMSRARTPMWIGVLNPAIGVVGVLLGGAMVRPKISAQTNVAERSVDGRKVVMRRTTTVDEIEMNEDKETEL